MNEAVAFVAGFIVAAVIARSLIRLAYVRGLQQGIAATIQHVADEGNRAMVEQIQQFHADEKKRHGLH